MDFPRTRRRVQEINLIALIDIVFHLMVFVVLTTSFVVSESMELSLPAGKASAVSNPNVMRLQLISDGSVQVDGRAMSLTQMNDALGERLGVHPDTKIAIFTTAGVSVQQLISVMDTVYLTGGRNLQVDKVE